MPRIIGKFPSAKMNRMVSYQSLIELDFIHLLDFDARIKTYDEQPFVVNYVDGRKHRRYTPDFYFQCDGRGHLIECKHIDYVNEHKNRLKWEAARRWCRSNNAQFHVVMNTQIRQGCRLENVKLLHDHAQFHVDVQKQARMLNILAQAQSRLHISDLMTAISPNVPTDAIVDVLYMIYHHKIVASLDEPITVNSPIHLPIVGENVCLLPFERPQLEGGTA